MALSFDKRLAIAIIVVAIAISGMVWLYISSPIETRDSDRALFACVFICKAAKNQGQSLDNGPCLSSVFEEWEVEDWVCDVAHWPREEVDNLPENQCPEYGVTASHFVELNPECEFIRAV
jgi:hypothetical protein